MTPSEMYAEFQSYLDVGDGFLSGDEVWRKLDNANREICRIVAREDPTYFVQSYSITLVAGQTLYDLPLNARLGSRILFTEDVDNKVEIMPVQELREHLDFDTPGIVNATSTYHFIMENDKVRIMGEPGSSGKSVRVWYIPSFGQMIEGQVANATTTTLDLFKSAPNYTQNYGRPDVRNDFYNGMRIRILSNNGVGDERTISDYTGGATKRVTVDTAWSVTPTGSEAAASNISTFAILSPLPEDFHQMIPMRAAIDGAIKSRNRLQELQSAYYGSPGRGGLERNLLGWLTRRHESNMNVVVPMEVGH